MADERPGLGYTSPNLLGPDPKIAGIITDDGISAARAVDLPKVGAGEVTLTVRSGFGPGVPSARYEDNTSHTPMRARLERFRDALGAEARGSLATSDSPSTDPESRPAPPRGPSDDPSP